MTMSPSIASLWHDVRSRCRSDRPEQHLAILEKPLKVEGESRAIQQENAVGKPCSTTLFRTVHFSQWRHCKDTNVVQENAAEVTFVINVGPSKQHE